MIKLIVVLLSFTCHASDTVLIWNSVSNASSYGLYTGTNTKQYTKLDLIAGTNVSINNQIQGKRYFNAITSISSSGLESQYSSEISYIAGDSNVYEYLTNFVPWFQIQYSTNMNSANWLNYGNPFRGGFTNSQSAYLRFKWLSNQVVGVTILTNPPVDTNMFVKSLIPFVNQ